MKLFTASLALALAAVGTTVHAQADIYANALTGLVATPNPLNITGNGGLVYTRSILVTNYGPGFASNLNAAFTLQSGTTGDISVVSDTCTGATLATGGTCTVRVMFDSGCPKAGAVRYNLVVTSTSMASLTDVVTGNTTAGVCR